MQSIIVAFSREEDAKRIRSGLIHHGITSARTALSGAQVLQQIGELDGGVVICGYKLRDMIYLDLAENLPEHFRVLLVSSASRVADDVFPENVVYVETPVKMADLVETLDLLIGVDRRKKKSHKPKPHSEAEQQTLTEAKTVLMERNHMTEPEAHRYLQKSAMDAGNSIVEAAEMVLLLYAKFREAAH